MMYIAI